MVKKSRKRKWDSVYFTSETVNSCCCTEGCFMEQKHLDLCVVLPLIDCPGPRLLRVCWILSEHLLECWEDENHRLRRHTTAAWQTEAEKNNCGSPHRGTNGDRKRGDIERRVAQTYSMVSRSKCLLLLESSIFFTNKMTNQGKMQSCMSRGWCQKEKSWSLILDL